MFYSLYFGDSSDNLSVQSYVNISPTEHLLTMNPFSSLLKHMQIRELKFLRQVHGTNGFVIAKDHDDTVRNFTTEGDFLITQVPGIAIGVMTADCVPLVIVDSINRVVGVIHAGWKGILAGVLEVAFENMKQHCNTRYENVEIIIGPCALVCCYQVQDDVASKFKQYDESSVVIKNGIQHLDLVLYTKNYLQKMEIAESSFNMQYTQCTICCVQFCSVRRQGINAGRQMTVVSIK